MAKKLAIKKETGYNVTPKKKGTTTTLVSSETKKGPSIFQPEDKQGGTVHKRATTKGMIPGENKAKEAKRIAIQTEGMKTNALPKGSRMVGNKVAYDSGKAKGELAGSMRSLTIKTPGYSHTVQPLIKRTDIPDRGETTKKTFTKQSSGKKSGKDFGSRKYTLKFKDDGGAGKPESSYYNKNKRAKMMKRDQRYR
jgi:hypothetical protein